MLGRAAEADAFSLDFYGSCILGRLCELKEFRVYTAHLSLVERAVSQSSRREEDWDLKTRRPVEKLSGLS